MENPLFSVLTPSFNQGRFLRTCIESVRAQTIGPIEHIVMDGGSHDESAAIASGYPHLTWISEKDRGQSHALNKAFALSRGKYIAWINSDDYLLAGALTAAYAKLKLSPIVMGGVVCVDEAGQELSRVDNVARSWFDILKYWVDHACPAQPGIFFQRSALESVLRSDGTLFDEKLRYAMDLELWLRLAKKYPFSTTIPEYLSAFRMHQSSKSSSEGKGMLEEACMLFDQYVALGKSNSDLPKEISTEGNCVSNFWQALERDESSTLCFGVQGAFTLPAQIGDACALVMELPRSLDGFLSKDAREAVERFEPSYIFKFPALVPRFVIRRAAALDIRPHLPREEYQFWFRELLHALAARAWDVAVVCSERDPPRRYKFVDDSAAQLVGALSNMACIQSWVAMRECEPFSRQRIRQGHAATFSDDIVRQSARFLATVPPDWRRLLGSPTYESLKQATTQYPQFAAGLYLQLAHMPAERTQEAEHLTQALRQAVQFLNSLNAST